MLSPLSIEPIGTPDLLEVQVRIDDDVMGAVRSAQVCRDDPSARSEYPHCRLDASAGEGIG
jgi:hypothetical protein